MKKSSFSSHLLYLYDDIYMMVFESPELFASEHRKHIYIKYTKKYLPHQY